MKRQLLISGLIAAAVTAFGAAGITSGELDLPGLNQAINSLDARTTNNEHDIQALQTSTQTTPAPHVDVPGTPVPTVAPAAPAAVMQAQPAAVAAPAPTPVPTPCPTAVVTTAPGMSITVITPKCE